MVLGAAKLALLNPVQVTGQTEGCMLLIDNAQWLSTLFNNDVHFLLFLESY